jgi:hypothetical protein
MLKSASYRRRSSSGKMNKKAWKGRYSLPVYSISPWIRNHSLLLVRSTQIQQVRSAPAPSFRNANVSIRTGQLKVGALPKTRLFSADVTWDSQYFLMYNHSSDQLWIRLNGPIWQRKYTLSRPRSPTVPWPGRSRFMSMPPNASCTSSMLTRTAKSPTRFTRHTCWRVQKRSLNTLRPQTELSMVPMLTMNQCHQVHLLSPARCCNPHSRRATISSRKLTFSQPKLLRWFGKRA